MEAATGTGDSVRRRARTLLAGLAASLVVALLAGGCAGGAPAAAVQPAAVVRPIDGLRAFAILYGRLRYFHPSDEAASIDWERLAMLGAEEVLGARDTAELEERLEAIFLPVAPTLVVYQEGEAPAPYRAPARRDGMEVVAWQHLGLGLTDGIDGNGGVYRSVRVGRPAPDGGDGGDPAGPLFPELPSVDEVVDRPIGAGLRARFPLALLSEGGRTLGGAAPAVSAAAIGPLRRRLAALEAPAGSRAARLGAVVIAWNVLQHFYPYFDAPNFHTFDTDWDAALTAALEGALAARTEEEHHATLRRLVAALHDGHGGVYPVEQDAPGVLPVRLDHVEGRIAVTASADPALEPGDVVVSIDGRPAAERLAGLEALVSGSPQWRRHRALDEITEGPAGATAQVAIERGGEARQVEVARIHPFRLPAETRPEPIAELDGGVFYVDLSRASMTEIGRHLERLAAAPGVVFDLRGYPDGNHFVLQFLLEEPCLHEWMFVPKIIRPDREGLVGWQPHGWWLRPAQPRIEAPVAFLTGPGAISYAESVMAHVEGHRLGAIVGAATAGANGNVNPFTLPGGYRVFWTGMRVLRHDGSPLHAIGVQPTVPAGRTLAGVRAGRDEVLEAALAHLRARGR